MSEAGTLKIQNVSKQYPSQNGVLDVLSQINLDIKAGEFISIVGSSGCGKSTLLRLLIGLDENYDGDILLDGERIKGTSLNRGIVFQEHRLFPWLTVEQNVAVGLLNSDKSKAEKQQLVDKHIELVGLSSFRDAYPAQLSGGMSQRVAIARGLVNRPEILLLDEPFGALDAVTRAKLQQDLQDIWAKEGITMVLVTHDVEEAVFLGDKVVVMEPRPGKIKRVIENLLPHPRQRESFAFNQVKSEVLQWFHPEAEESLINPPIPQLIQFAW